MRLTVFTLLMAVLLIFGGYIANARAHHDMHDMQGMAMQKPAEPVVKLKTDPEPIKTGVPEIITVSFGDTSGKPLTELTMTHDRIMHVVIAGSDFTVFAHIHPEDFGAITPVMKEAGRYAVHYTFPKAGRYIIGIDFAVKDEAYSKHFIVDAAGGAEMGRPVTDLARHRQFGDYDVRLKSDPEGIVAGKETILTYRFERGKAPVTDLEPYIAAVMHVAVISTDLKHFIHEHGSVPGMPMMEMGGHHMMHEMTLPSAFGPEIRVPVTFPAPGIYEIFGEVSHKGRVILTKFMVEVKE